MIVSTYDVMLDENQHNVLVKKEDFICEECKMSSPQAITNLVNDVFQLYEEQRSIFILSV